MPAQPNPVRKALNFIKAVFQSISDIITESVSNLFRKKNKDVQAEPVLRKRHGINRTRVYRLRGYTTTSRVDKKVYAEQNQRLLRNFLVAAIFVLIIAILLFIFNPLKDLRELFRMIGI